MADIDPALAQIPGLGAYLAARQYRQNQGLKDEQIGQQQQFLRQREALGSEATPEQLINLGARFSEPKDMAHAGVLQEAAKQKYEYFNNLLDAKLKQIDLAHEVNMAKVKDAETRTVLVGAKNQAEAQVKQMQLELDRLYKMSRLSIEQTKAAQGNKPPSGYRTTPAGDLEAIPGGPADTKLQGALNQDTASLNESISNMDRLAREANELKEHPGLGGITGLSGVIPNIPGGAAANAQAKLDTLRSQTAFGVLQNMRNNSKTGGALGQVSNIEEKMLQDNLAALSRAQSTDEYKKSLQKVIEYTEGAKERLRAAYNMKHSAKQPGLPSASDIDVEIRRRQGGR